MGYKAVCFNCRKAFNYNAYADNQAPAKCPDCSQPLALLNQKFQPPKKSDAKAWEVVKFLSDKGFPFHHVYKDVSKSLKVDVRSSENYVDYPTTMKEAVAFVEMYKAQARK
mgnify:CR=1 FL=1